MINNSQNPKSPINQRVSATETEECKADMNQTENFAVTAYSNPISKSSERKGQSKEHL